MSAEGVRREIFSNGGGEEFAGVFIGGNLITLKVGVETQGSSQRIGAGLVMRFQEELA